MGLFGNSSSKDPKEMVKEWTSKIRKEGYQLDRQIKAIQREEAKAKRFLKEAAKKGDKASCNILAKEIVNSRKAVGRLYIAKAQLSSVGVSMKGQLATLRVAGCLEKSTAVMKSMQTLVKVPEVMKTMQDMSKEMMKMGILEEMMDDTLEMMDDADDELEEDAQREVDKVLYELTAGALGEAPDAVQDSLPVPEGATADAEDSSEEEEVEEMQARLEALRS